MNEVFVNRMGGARRATSGSPPSRGGLEPRARARLAPGRSRGRCRAGPTALRVELSGLRATCHSGPTLTNNVSIAVGTGSKLQVPSLVGVGMRAPLMHDGCAPTLMDRFDAACGGGDAHGKTSQLSDAQLEDLVAYMNTL